MLAGLRDVAKSKFAAPVIVLLAVSFGVWGVQDAFTGRAADAVATVGPEKVTINDFSQAFRTQVNNLSQGGQVMTTPEARAAGIDQQVLSQMITQAALTAKAGQLRIAASDLAVARDINSTAAFRDTVRGEFSRDVYRNAIASVGLTPEQYEETLRRDITRQQIVSALLVPAHTPSQLVDARLTYRNETRTAEVLILPAALVSVDDTPDDAALQAVLDENAAGFTFPELRGITVVWLDMETMQAVVDVTEEDVRALYEFRRDSLSTPATRAFAQIAAPDEATANAAAERLRAGEAPAAVAAALGLAAPIVQSAAAQPDIVDSVIAAQVFESAAPRVFVAEGSLGWAAVQVTGGAEAVAPTYEQAADQLRAELAEEGASDTLYDIIAMIEDARGAGLSLEEAAAQAGVAAQAYEPVSAQGQDAAGDVYVDLASNPAVLAAAFSLAPSQTSEMLELQDGGYAMVRVDTVTPQRVATLDEMRGETETLWRAIQVDERLAAIEADARTQIEAGASFADVAAGIGQPARTEIAIVKRGETAGPVDANLSATLFAAAQGELVSGRTGRGGRALARVTRIETQDAPDPVLASSLQQELTNDLLTQFQNAIGAEYPVRTYPDQISLALGDTPQ